MADRSGFQARLIKIGVRLMAVDNFRRWSYSLCYLRMVCL